MIRALWISGGVVLVALFAMFKAPSGQADPLGTLFRTALAVALLVFLGRLVGTAEHRRPPRALAPRVVILIFVTVAIEVAAMGFSPNWSIALAVWYLALFATGVLMNRWCDAPDTGLTVDTVPTSPYHYSQRTPGRSSRNTRQPRRRGDETRSRAGTGASRERGKRLRTHNQRRA